jgi:hypothetical protein
MALPNDGTLSGNQIDIEFPNSIDGGRPMALSEYRGVRASRNGTPYNLPASPNPIAYSDFRGVTAGYNIDVLIVGGGGGGGAAGPGNSLSGGGGGGGEVRIITAFVIPGLSYHITIGYGGAGGIYPGNSGHSITTSRGFNGLRSGFDTEYAQGGFGGGSAENTNGKGGNNNGSGGGAGVRPGTFGSGGNVNESNDFDSGRRNDGGGSANYSSGAEGGGGGGSNSPGLTAISSGSNGVGGSGYNLDNFMGTANYRKNEEWSYSDPVLHRVNGQLVQPNQTITLNRTDNPANPNYVYTVGFGVGGGGGGGRWYRPNGVYNHAYISGRDGGGFGCFPAERPFAGDQLRDARPRTGGGGGGGCSGNGSGNGGQGVVIVRYQGHTVLDRSNTNSQYIQRLQGFVGVNNIPYTFVVFGNPTGNSTITDPQNTTELIINFIA